MTLDELTQATQARIVLLAVPDYQASEDECEDCGHFLWDCRCADLCTWSNYDGAGKCRDPRDREATDDNPYCTEHLSEAEATRYDDDEYGVCWS